MIMMHIVKGRNKIYKSGGIGNWWEIEIFLKKGLTVRFRRGIIQVTTKFMMSHDDTQANPPRVAALGGFFFGFGRYRLVSVKPLAQPVTN